MWVMKNGPIGNETQCTCISTIRLVALSRLSALATKIKLLYNMVCSWAGRIACKQYQSGEHKLIDDLLHGATAIWSCSVVSRHMFVVIMSYIWHRLCKFRIILDTVYYHSRYLFASLSSFLLIYYILKC